MKFSLFLHFYQPAGQVPDILEAIVNQCYRPLVNGLLEIPELKISANINGALVELLDKHGYSDVIEGIQRLAQSERLEFTESAKYHPFLPLLPDAEIERQIKINHETNKRFFGSCYKPRGFFPPEMGYDENIGKIARKMGYEWILLDEVAYNGKNDRCDFSKSYTIKDSGGLKVYFRNRKTSNVILGAFARNMESLKEILDVEENKYVIAAMDAETFGHHHPGLEKLLFEMLKSDFLNPGFVSEISDSFEHGGDISPLASTWSSTEEDITKNIQFLSWRDPENIIHKIQWEFFDFMLKKVREAGESENFDEIRKTLDIAEASDHFWWASAKPWWSLEMIELGAWQLLNVLNKIKNLPPEEYRKGENFYHQIISHAFEWQRIGKVRQMAYEMKEAVRIPFKDRTIYKEIYYAFLEIIKQKMKEAAENEEYEKAILWRDAIWKLETKNDIYDTVHAIDLLRMEMPSGELEQLLDQYKEKYDKIRSGQLEQRNLPQANSES